MKILQQKSKSREKEFNPETFLYMFILFLFVVSATLDLAVTITMFHVDPANIDQEANKLFIWGINQNLPMLFNPTIWIQYIILTTYLVLFYNKDKSKWYKTFFFGLACSLIILAIAHFWGAASWLY